jgi:hypothetical protein
MRYILLLLITVILSNAQSLSLNKEETKKKQIYRIRFLSLHKTHSKEAILKSIPKYIRKYTKIIDKKNYYLATYKEVSTITEARKNLKFIQNAGYKDAYIRKSDIYISSLHKQHYPLQKRKKISKYQLSNMAFTANNAYKKGDYTKAMIYYEMMLAAGIQNRKIKNNLCYLYGRIGAFNQAEDIIKNTSYPAKLIYAYAYGAALNQQKNYYQDLSKYILLDHTGRLLLLTAYYFENKKDLNRAIQFYKMAYQHNPSDPYILFAYARSLDQINSQENALKLYKKVAEMTTISSQLYKVTTLRIQQLER